MYKLFRPLFFNLSNDPETVHNLALSFLKFVGIVPLSTFVNIFTKVESPALKQKVFGLDFKNPVGMAAGFDKSAKIFNGLFALGFGYVEIGTLTKLPQDGNPRQRMFRLEADEAIINRMGFNNEGVGKIKENLKQHRGSPILGVSLGKNKDTVLEKAADEYLHLYKELYEFGDYFVVNVSSPNTPNLRQLQDKGFLVEIVSALKNYRDQQKIYKPLLVKIAPDLSFEAINEIIAVCQEQKIDGVIVANTSIGRDGLKTKINEAGGLSGQPVKEKSTQIIRHVRNISPELTIIGVGGIFTAVDAYEKIKAGASLVQIYTGFIYEGPFIVKKINQGLIELLNRDGFKNIKEAIGKG